MYGFELRDFADLDTYKLKRLTSIVKPGHVGNSETIIDVEAFIYKRTLKEKKLDPNYGTDIIADFNFKAIKGDVLDKDQIEVQGRYYSVEDYSEREHADFIEGTLKLVAR